MAATPLMAVKLTLICNQSSSSAQDRLDAGVVAPSRQGCCGMYLVGETCRRQHSSSALLDLNEFEAFLAHGVGEARIECDRF